MSSWLEEVMNPFLIKKSIPWQTSQHDVQPVCRCKLTFLGFELKDLMPSSRVVFRCFALSNRPGSSSGSCTGVWMPEALDAGRVSSVSLKLARLLGGRTSSLIRPFFSGRGVLCSLIDTLPTEDMRDAAMVLVPRPAHDTKDRKVCTSASKACRLTRCS